MRAPKRSELPSSHRGRKVIRLLVSLAILAVIAYIGIALFTPLDLTVGTVSTGRLDELWQIYSEMAEGGARVAGRQVVINSAEATGLFNRMIGLDQDDPEAVAGALVPTKLFIELLPQNRVRAVLRYKVFNQLTSDTVLVGRLEVPDGTDKVEFIPESYQIGTLPMKWHLESLVMGRFHQQFHDLRDLEMASRRVQSLSIEQNRATIRVKSN